MKKFEKIFEAVKIGRETIRNRIALAPMGNLGLINPDGSFSQRGIDYFTERAIGEVGLIITGVVKVENEVDFLGTDSINLIPIANSTTSSSFSKLADSMHRYGSKLFVQLTAGFGRVLPGLGIDLGIKPVSASEIPAYWRPDVMTRAISTSEVEGMVEAFGRAAKILATTGVDGIELHGHEGYLFDQFTTAIWNKRDDKYGGDLEDRLTFPIEALNSIKDGAGKDFPVIYRFGLKHYIKGLHAGALKDEDFKEAGRDIEEGIEMAKLLEKAGFDALEVDAGCYDSWYWAHPPIYQPHGCMADMAERVKKVVDLPVLTVGRLGIPELAETILEEKRADMVVLGRALLSDPHWVKKVREGRVEDIRPCIGCHDGCLYRIYEDFRSLSCAVAPATGREKIYGIEPTKESKKVLIAGGGPAGMEAARVLSIRGHDVTLYEKSDALGGHLIEAGIPEFKADIKRLLKWYKIQLDKLKVKIKLKTEVTSQLIRDKKPDVLIVAAGSTPIIPKMPGIEKQKVITAIDLLLGKKKSGERVVVLGGGLVGCETALWLAEQGKETTVVEMLPEVATGICHANRVMLLDLLAKNEVDVITKMTIQEITDGGVLSIDKDLNKTVIECDTVVLAVGLKPSNEIYNSMDKEISHIYAIGDCKEARKIMDAIWEGYDVSRTI